MRGRSHGQLAALIALAATMGGCVQATRHSNTMLFGTNTSFGIHAGTATGNVPEVNVGYSRQEAVVMPLVANVADDGRIQAPCEVKDTGSGVIPHPCLLVGVHGEVRDSYSVLASFGAEFDGSVQSTNAGAKGGLAQYFATGVAAQMLALTGGASVVALGDAARAAAGAPPSATSLEAMFGATVVTEGVARRNAYFDFRDRVLAKIQLTADAALPDRVGAFEQQAGVAPMGVAAACQSRAACRAAMIDRDPYRPIYSERKDAFEQALKGWKTDQ